jgi:carbon monoxide dehydrogenase subunit G
VRHAVGIGVAEQGIAQVVRCLSAGDRVERVTPEIYVIGEVRIEVVRAKFRAACWEAESREPVVGKGSSQCDGDGMNSRLASE